MNRDVSLYGIIADLRREQAASTGPPRRSLIARLLRRG